MKKLIKLLLVVIAVVLMCGCNSKAAKEFKKEYEDLNGKTNSAGKAHRVISIPEDNPYEKVTAKEILEKIEDKETFYVYFGDPLCPWCRSVLEKSIEVAKQKNIKKIYYVKIWDSEGTEVLRSKYSLGDNNEVNEIIKGTKEYYKLLEVFDSLLNDYTLTDKNGDTVGVGEKRIYAPNYIYVENGVAKKLVEGISDKQTDSRMDLTEEMLKDEEEAFNELFNN